MTSHIMPTYGRLPITFVKGEGAWLWNTDNQRYLDALSGIAVCNLGHAHPAVHQAICEQSQYLIHTSNLYGIEPQEKLATRLAQLSGMDNVFFCNSGAEANEAALKIARLWGHQKQVDQPVVISFQQSFHGRTFGAMSATGNSKIQQGFDPLLPGFLHIPYNDVGALEQAIKTHPEVIAVLLEPVQGEGGVNIPEGNYLNQVRQLCDQHDLLMILDEVQTGIGRTGQFLAFQHSNIVPDICTLAKALGNGVPIGACLAKGKAAKIFSPGQHGSTFGGNHLACSAALAVIDTLKKHQLIEQATLKGEQICQQLQQKLANNHHVVNIRHQGLMIGIELDQPCSHLVTEALKEKLLINVTAEKTIRLLPPLIITEEQITLMTDILSKLISAQP
jgi:acetylornithine aminotransferase